jgi:hypothetical protein
MNGRRLLLIPLVALAATPAANAQQTAKLVRIGLLDSAAADPASAAPPEGVS